MLALSWTSTLLISATWHTSGFLHTPFHCPLPVSFLAFSMAQLLKFGILRHLPSPLSSESFNYYFYAADLQIWISHPDTLFTIQGHISNCLQNTFNRMSYRNLEINMPKNEHLYHPLFLFLLQYFGYKLYYKSPNQSNYKLEGHPHQCSQNLSPYIVILFSFSDLPSLFYPVLSA